MGKASLDCVLYLYCCVYVAAVYTKYWSASNANEKSPLKSSQVPNFEPMQTRTALPVAVLKALSRICSSFDTFIKPVPVRHVPEEGIKVNGWEEINFDSLKNQPKHMEATESISLNPCSSAYCSK